MPMSKTKRQTIDTDLDPVTYQIIKHRLFRVTDEASAHLKRVSASPLVTEGHDFIVSIYNAEGDLLTAGMGVLQHMMPASESVKHIIEKFDEEYINPGDMFMQNDPYTAAMHAPDMYLIAPIFHEGELRGWSSSFVHLPDNGAIDIGGFSHRATEKVHDGFQTDGLKLVDGGDVRPDVMGTLRNMSRMPDMAEMDMRSQIAANNVAKERMTSIMDEYGSETVDEVGDQLVEESEQKFRKKLEELPDGSWQARQYVDSEPEDKLYTVDLELRKEGDTLTFDYEGTSEQSDIGLNCTKVASYGGTAVVLLTLLAEDVTWNDGLLNAIDVVAPDGTIVNCTEPATPNTATITTIQTCNQVATISTSKMLAANDAYDDRATAVWHGSFGGAFFGTEQQGQYNMAIPDDAMAGAGGATAVNDGVHLGGELVNTVARWGNVENHESTFPFVYLFRRYLEDTGGPGKNRGGAGHEWAATMLEPAGEVDANTFGKGGKVPHGMGIFGGYSGATLDYSLFTDTNVWDLGLDFPYRKDDDAIEFDEQINAQWGSFTMTEGDVFYLNYAGSGGYGDSLERDPEKVVEDVDEGFVAPETAEEVYGVPISEDGGYDENEVEEKRDEILQERLDADEEFTPPVAHEETSSTGLRLGEYIDIVEADGEQYSACNSCDTVLAPHEENWKDHVVVRESPPTDAGRYRESHEDIRLREFVCPNCGRLLDSNNALKDDRFLHDQLAEF